MSSPAFATATGYHLLRPLTLTGGQLTLRSRIIMAPLTRGRAGPSRVPNALMAAHYAQRASAGLIIAEATAVSEQGYGWPNAPGIYTEEQVEGWKLVTEAVHAKGGLIFLQLWHMGRQSHSSHQPNGQRPVSASALAMAQKVMTPDGTRVEPEVPRALDTEEIPGVVEQYRQAAVNAKAAGFDGVEVHSANGYLLDQFLQSCSNQRTDAYGGSMENRARLLCEVLDAVTSVWPAGRVGVRLAPNGVYGSMGSPDNHDMFLYLAKRLRSYNLGYCHVMDGLGFGFHEKCAPVTLFDFRQVYGADRVLMGNVCYTKDLAEGAIRTGAVDAIAFGRPYISNPDLVERFTHGLPVAPDPPMSAWYGGGGPEGYTDWPTAEADNGGSGGGGGKAAL